MLRLRALESVLLLFRVEQLKRFIIDTVHILRRQGAGKAGVERWSLRRTAKFLVDELVISQCDADELAHLTNYRNQIAHETYRLSKDIGSYRDSDLEAGYQPDALQRLSALERKVEAQFAGRFIMSISLAPVWFEAARATYEADVQRLRARIRRRSLARRIEVDEANLIIRGLPEGLLKRVNDPSKAYRKGNGTFNTYGIALIDDLYQAGATPFVVAHLMHMSLRAAKRHQSRG